MNRKLEWLKGLLRFTALSAGLLMLVSVLHWIPAAVDKEGLKPFATVEQLKGEAGFGRVLIPSYFPEGIKWPPRLVLGQVRPFMAAVIELDSKEVERFLVISESSSPDFEPGNASRFFSLRQSVNIELKGRNVLVETGLCKDASSCSRLSWDEEGLHVRILMHSPSLELIRIAESMLN